jgi:hypothetical protein
MSPVFQLLHDDYLKLHIMEYIHKDLCHLLSVALSNRECHNLKIEPLFLYCEKRKTRIVRNGTLPVSLLFRANLFKDGFKLPGFKEGPRAKLQPIVNLNWNTDSLRIYAKKQAMANLHTSFR